MKLEQALKEIKYIKESPLVRECAVCKLPLDEASEVIMNNREGIEWVVSHGYHKECIEKFLNGEIIT